MTNVSQNPEKSDDASNESQSKGLSRAQLRVWLHYEIRVSGAGACWDRSHAVWQQLPKELRRGLISDETAFNQTLVCVQDFARQMRVVVAPSITRISNINTSEESFRAKFFITFTWPGGPRALEAYKSFSKKPLSGAVCTLKKKQLQWCPKVNFPDAVDEHYIKWHNSKTGETAENGKEEEHETFIVKGDGDDKVNIRAVLVCDITFFEDFELEHLPFDCQDLTIKIEGRNSTHSIFEFHAAHRHARVGNERIRRYR